MEAFRPICTIIIALNAVQSFPIPPVDQLDYVDAGDTERTALGRHNESPSLVSKVVVHKRRQKSDNGNKGLVYVQPNSDERRPPARSEETLYAQHLARAKRYGKALVLICPRNKFHRYQFAVCQRVLQWHLRYTADPGTGPPLLLVAGGVGEQQAAELGVPVLPAAVLLVAGGVFKYHNLVGTTRQQFYQWLDSYMSVKSHVVDEPRLQSVLTANGDSVWILYIEHCPEFCKPFWWDNMAISVTGQRYVHVGHVPVRTSATGGDTALPLLIALRAQLPELFHADGRPACGIVMLHSGRYHCAAGTHTPDSLLFAAFQLLGGQLAPTHTVSTRLSAVQRTYMIERAKVDRTKADWTYLAVGFIGGITVNMLAVSIFWGLHTSRFGGSADGLK